MKKTYQTPVITVIEIAVESQILAASSLPISKDDEYNIDYPGAAHAPGMRYFMDDEEEEYDGSY